MRGRYHARALFCLMLALLFSGCRPVLAELPWPETLTAGQEELKAYIERVNGNLQAMGEQPVNSLFGCYPALAVLGITQQEQAETLEDVDLNFTFNALHVEKAELRCSDISRFPKIAAALLQAALPEELTLDSALRDPTAKARQALKDPTTSFEDHVDTAIGITTRAYYRYEPNPYHMLPGEEVDYISLILVFPFTGLGEGELQTAPPAGSTVRTNDDGDIEWDGYTDGDDYTHLEVFVSPTPEPFVPDL